MDGEPVKLTAKEYGSWSSLLRMLVGCFGGKIYERVWGERHTGREYRMVILGISGKDRDQSQELKYLKVVGIGYKIEKY